MPAYRCQRLFWLFICLHVVVWTLLPNIVRHNLPLDTMEGITWGQYLQWGYDKNPLVNAWLSRGVVALFGHVNWPFYLLSQLCIVLGIWSVWQLAKKILTPPQALVASLCLAGVYYFNIAATQFNDNVIELAVWPLLTLAFYHAIMTKKYRAWFWVGLLAAVATLTKYYAVVLFLPMAIFVFQHRDMDVTRGFCFAIFVGLACLLPHALWLAQHHYITVHYAFLRAQDETMHWFNHLENPILFFAEQAGAFLPALLCLACLGKGTQSDHSQEVWAGRFVWVMGLGSLVVTLLLSLVTGMHLEAMWGVPLVSLWGVLIVYVWQPAVAVPGLKRFSIMWLAVVALMAFGYYYAQVLEPYRNQETGTGNFPGFAIAKKVTQQWHAKFHRPLAYVVGPRWLAGNVAFYSTDKPKVYMDWQPWYNPKISLAAVHTAGAVLIWWGDITISPDIRQTFSPLQPEQLYSFQQLTGAKVPLVSIHVAMMAPKE